LPGLGRRTSDIAAASGLLLRRRHLQLWQRCPWCESGATDGQIRQQRNAGARDLQVARGLRAIGLRLLPQHS
jgi:hypothetical protein